MAGAAPDVAPEELYLRRQLVYGPVSPAVLAPGLDIRDPYRMAQTQLVRIVEERAAQEYVLYYRIPARDGVMAGKAPERQVVEHDAKLHGYVLHRGRPGRVRRAEREFVQLVFKLVMAHHAKTLSGCGSPQAERPMPIIVNRMAGHAGNIAFPVQRQAGRRRSYRFYVHGVGELQLVGMAADAHHRDILGEGMRGLSRGRFLDVAVQALAFEVVVACPLGRPQDCRHSQDSRNYQYEGVLTHPLKS